MIGLSRKTGRAISGDDHLLQSIRDILTTPIGSRVMRRDYGSVVPFMIDQPANASTLMQIRASVFHSILLWEPRVTPKLVTLDITSNGVSNLYIEYQDAKGKSFNGNIALRAAA